MTAGNGAEARVGRDLTTGPVLQGLLSFALPIVLANMVQQLYSMADLMVIGRFVGNVGTVGVNTGGEFADLLTPVATALSMAGQIYIAQLTGAKEEQKLRDAAGSFLSLMMAVSLVIAAMALLGSGFVLRLLQCPEEALGQARAYMMITGAGLPFVFGYNAVCGLLRGMGDSRRPLLFVVIAAAVNILLDILLVVVIPLEAAGTAIATVFSQAASFAAAFVCLYRRRKLLGFELKRSYFKIRLAPTKVILGLGLPQAARMLLVRGSVFWVNSQINACGAIASGTNGIGNKLQKLLDIYSISVSQAAAAMVGQNLGARNFQRAKQVVLCTLWTSLAAGAVTAAIEYFWPEAVFSIFTTDADVISLGAVYMRIMIIHVFISAFTSSYQAMVIGAGNAALNFVIGTLDGMVCKIGLSLMIVNLVFGVSPQTDWRMTALGYFWGTALSRLIPAIITMFYFYGGYWKRRKSLAEI